MAHGLLSNVYEFFKHKSSVSTIKKGDHLATFLSISSVIVLIKCLVGVGRDLNHLVVLFSG